MYKGVVFFFPLTVPFSKYSYSLIFFASCTCHICLVAILLTEKAFQFGRAVSAACFWLFE